MTKLEIAAIYSIVLAIMNAPADLPPPHVTLVPIGSLPGRSGEYQRGEIRVEDDACRDATLAHEFSHHVAIETGMLDSTPNALVKQRLEEIAHDVEERSSEFQPNCYLRGSQ